ncbi:sister chromatid cohesion protein PDS5 homolog B isoform X1 [Ctenocephalides felis]|uniref:sister chromatid cohesion protein PDS5 homolog B isoform X1 n=1 Tax=Ctenocephalides felis TaxID=7515 RepID=UPI000E6E534D|nr:sister chromatid cohesion protein PDS5 homolog B isoform X1 [Ctenocephalides felis]
MADIEYPNGCRPVSENLGADELIRRLKTLAHTLQAMSQDEGKYQQYIPLALYLVEEHFLNYPSRDVQLLIACCIADVLRVFAPDAPYKDPEQVKTIFVFLIKQLSGLKDPKDPAFKRYFYLLENLAYVKSFNMCFELEDCQEIFCALFTLMFKIVNDEHSSKVKSFMLDVLCPLIKESDVVSNELLDIILINIVDPYKTQRKNAYLLAKELVVQTSKNLEPYIHAFFNQQLILDKEERELNICSKVYELIYELNHICPTVLITVLPQLECKLKSAQETERLRAVALLATMFSEKDSTLASQHPALWRAFLGRFNDIAIAIRIKCVQYSMHFLLNHPDLRKDITETLKLRQHDADETVRYEVVMAIVTTARKDFEVVSDSEDLLEFVKERTLDKKFKIRKEAMTGLAMIYKKHLNDADVPQATKKAVTWIKDKILHGYYMTGMEDRLLVERLLNTCLVPYQLSAEERMKKLYHLLGTIDDHASKAFVELQKHQLAVRRAVTEWIELHKKPLTPITAKELAAKIHTLSRFLPEPVKAHEFLTQFSHNLRKDTALMQGMEIILKPDVTCKECTETLAIILKKLGQPIMTNLYYNTVKMLLERVSSVMVDAASIAVLVGYVDDCLRGGNTIDEVGLSPNSAGERGLRLLVMLSFVFPCHFNNLIVLKPMLQLLQHDDEMVAPLALSVFTFVGKYKPLGETYPEILLELAPLCKQYAEVGTPKQAKQAIRCMYVNKTEKPIEYFTEILEVIKNSLVPGHPNYRTAIVSLGHIAYNLPQKFPIVIKNIVSRKIVKELLVKEASDNRDIPEGEWCSEEELPEETRCKIEGLKTMARWLLGLKQDELSAQKTFRMLNAFIIHKGDLLQQGNLSDAEMSWLRLSAGTAMLKICEQKGVGDQFTAEQFYNLSQLMVDPVAKVREIFAGKLHKGLGRGIPNKCLPLDFMGFYALSGYETDRRLANSLRVYTETDVVRRREYVKTITNGTQVEKAMTQLTHILPDYMLVFAIPVLAHDPRFTRYDEVHQLKTIERCLWNILEPLVSQKEFYSFGFYKNLIERMKNHKDALNSNDDSMNYKLWAICDLAMGLILSKTSNYDLKEYPSETRIPSMYFQPQPDNFVNTKIYIPPEVQVQTIKKAVTLSIVPENKGIKRKAKRILVGVGPQGTDVEPSEASETKIQLPGLDDDISSNEPVAKRALRAS